MANRASVTLTAEMPSRRSLLEPSGFTSRRPGVSTTTVHVAPDGIEPRGSPFESSLTNSSPSPPSETPGAPATRPMRNSGSAPGVSGCGRAQAAAAATRLAPFQAMARRERRTRRAEQAGTGLVNPRLAQCRVQLCDGEVDIGIGVRAGDEAGPERRGGGEYAPPRPGPGPRPDKARTPGLA